MFDDQLPPFTRVLDASFWDSHQSEDPPLLASKTVGTSTDALPPIGNDRLISNNEPLSGGANAAGFSHVRHGDASGQNVFDDVLAKIPDLDTMAPNGASIEDFEPFEFDLEAILKQHPLPVEGSCPSNSRSPAPLSSLILNAPPASINQGTHNDFSGDGNYGGLDPFDAFFRPAADATVQAILTLPTANEDLTSSTTVDQVALPSAVPDIQTLPAQPTAGMSTSADAFERRTAIKETELPSVFPANLLQTNMYLGGMGELHAASGTNLLDWEAAASMFYLPSGDFMPPISIATRLTTTGVASPARPDISGSSVIPEISNQIQAANAKEISPLQTTDATPSVTQPQETGSLTPQLLVIPYIPHPSPKRTNKASKDIVPSPTAAGPPFSTQSPTIRKAPYKQAYDRRKTKTSLSKALEEKGLPREVRYKGSKSDASIPCSFPSCMQTFSNKLERRQHEKLHAQTEDGKWFCPACGKEYSRDDALIRHLNRLRKAVPNHPCILLAVGLGWKPGVNGTGSNLRPALLREKGYTPRSRTSPPAIQTTATTGPAA